MRFAIVFWTFEAVLITVAVCLGVWLYRRIMRRPKDHPFKPLNFAIWIAVAGVLVVFFNLRGH